MANKKILKQTVRLLILIAALFFIIGGPLPAWMERLIPAFSPLSLLAESIAQRTWFAGLFWGLPGLAVLLLAVFKGRFFCQWLCPLGTLYSLPAKLSLKKKVLPVRLNALLFWGILTASAFGTASLLWLDPLSTVSRLGGWNQAVAWIPGLLIPLFLLISFFQPQAWCTHLCPLGYSFDLLNIKAGKAALRRDRRQFLAGLGIGGAAAAMIPRIGNTAQKNARPDSVLPPGARKNFADTCTRCYACVSACPSGIIQIKKGGPLNELAMPELVFDESGCDESCNQCSQACPTGAIRSIRQSEKRNTQIGIAAVIKDKCYAWADDEFCMLCADSCPYSAIDTFMKGDIDCPVVINDRCRGCGACESVCPAMGGRAIIIEPVHPQKQLT